MSKFKKRDVVIFVRDSERCHCSDFARGHLLKEFIIMSQRSSDSWECAEASRPGHFYQWFYDEELELKPQLETVTGAPRVEGEL